MQQLLKPEIMFSLEGEAAVLGSMILDCSCIDKAITLLSTDDFFQEEHRIIFDALIAERVKGADVDLVMLRDRLKNDRNLERVGGAEYLTRLAESVPATYNFKYYAGIVKDKARERGLIKTADEIRDIAETPGVVGEKTQKIQQIILSLNDVFQAEGITPIADHLLEAYNSLENPTKGAVSGFASLDYFLQGFHGGDLVIVAARPSIGKTSFALSMAANMARDGLSSLVFSLEMSKSQLTQRMICSEARVSMLRAKQHLLSDADLASLREAGDIIHDWPVFISQQVSLTPENLLAGLRTYKHRQKIDCVFVDYLQLMNDPTVKESRVQQITAISRKLKAIALQEQIPIVVLSQLSRKPEERTNKRPMLSDLRDSGAIEQDADIVLFLYRQGYYDMSDDNIAEVIIAKNRNGPCSKVNLVFNKEYVTFENKAEQGHD